MTVAGVVMAHPKRRAWAEELSSELGLPIVWDQVNDRHDTGLRCIEAGIGAAASHWLVIQDDAVVCRDLVDGVEAAVAVSGNRVVGLYVGNTRPQTGRVEKFVAAARANGSSWLEAPGPWWGVGVVIPVAYLADLADRFARSTEENYDRRIEKWVERTGVGCWYTIPSLIDHRHGEENPSLVHGRGHEGRRARYFIGADGSALSVDWTRAPIDGELWRNLRTGQTRNVRSDSTHARRFARSAEWERAAAYPQGVAICLICGVASCACGPKTEVVAVDQRVRSRDVKNGPLKRYPNPARPGSFLKLSDADAKRLGLTGGTPAPPVAPPRRADDVLNDLATAQEPVTSPSEAQASDVAATSASSSPSSEGLPPGALAPGGPTRRARAKKAEQGAPDAPATGEPKDKARPAPKRRRRRVDEDG